MDLFTGNESEGLLHFRLESNELRNIPVGIWNGIDHPQPCWYNRTLRNKYIFSAVADARPDDNGSHVVLSYQLDIPSNEDQSHPHLALLSSRVLSVVQDDRRLYTRFLTGINPWFTIGLHKGGFGPILWRTIDRSKAIDGSAWHVAIRLENSYEISDMSPCVGRILYARKTSNCVHVVDFM
jgi:hypothetical protein